jgi:hypothetical protein
MTSRFSPRPSDFSHDRTDNGAFWFDASNMPWRPKRVRRGIYGSTRLANRSDFEPFLETDPHASEELRSRLPFHALLLEGSRDGSVLDPLVYQSLSLPEDLRTRHLLAVGQTGCGKTTRFIYPLLASDLTQPRTIIAFDAKGKKLFPLVEGLAAHHRPGQKVHLLNFRDPARSVCWNPVQGIRSEGDAHDIAFKLCTIVDRGGEREGAFWLNNSIDLLTSILWALSQDPKEKATLGRAREIAHLPIVDFAKFADAHPKVGGLGRVCELYSDAHQTGACVFQDLRMRLSGFLDERVAATTGISAAQLDLDSLLRTGGMLVIEVNETDVGKLRQVINLFMNYLFARLIEVSASSPGGRLPVPCSLFLDEFASAVGKIDDMEVRLNTVRERGVSVTAAVQSLSQLAIYGNAASQVLAGFSSKLFFAGLEWSDAEYASRLGGLTTVLNTADEDEDEEDPSHGGTWMHEVRAPRIPVGRCLLLPEEVARPVKHPAFGPPATLFLADTPPAQIYLQPAYELPLLARLMEPAVEKVPATQSESSPTVRKIAQLKRRLGWDSASPAAREWWRTCEEQAPQREVLGTLEQLLPLHEVWRRLREPRQPLLDELATAAHQSGSRRLVTQVSFLHYRLLHRQEEERSGHGEREVPRG